MYVHFLRPRQTYSWMESTLSVHKQWKIKELVRTRVNYVTFFSMDSHANRPALSLKLKPKYHVSRKPTVLTT
jgi:hypothetical protein